ncbi:hypothetical protein [Staphylospora marina]|uniref:hypothetical protein n=1 Tax=Staphylospora marina TaxID=2490858 RepID=UPI000F5BDF46|nr:hypothetical protein [Staphylospora marina]
MGVMVVLVPVAMAAAGMLETRKTEQRELVLGTRMKNRDLLNKSLVRAGWAVEEKDGVLKVEGGPDKQLTIHLNDESRTHDFRFVGDWTEEEAAELVSLIQEEYTLLLQEQVYRRLKERASTRGLELESEEVQEDHSIVLTYTVQGGP